MNQYIVAYRCHEDSDMMFYTFAADDAEHAIEQFRDAETDITLIVVFVVVAL